ncbi:MAG: ABC transporter ATP-binding protein [Alphaproteobacteria bacterium]|nr:ABC transporter ATP-binding protein [Alphaproteobacteria bacterium]
MSPLLAVEDLHLRVRRFEGVHHILKGVAFTVAAGERLAIVGESGCGKSLTARVLLGLLDRRRIALSGRVHFAGTELLALPESGWRGLRGRRMAMIFQDPSTALNPVFTVGDQLRTVIRRGQSVGRADAQAQALAMLEAVAIPDPARVLAAFPFQLSGGLAQRVLIAMALVNRPDLIVADEPGTALDVTVQEQTLRLMRRLAEERRTAVILITHNLGVVRRFAERVCVMYGGSIVESGPVETIFARPAHPHTQALLRAVPRLTGGALPDGIDGSVPGYLAPPAGCRFRPRCARAIDACAEDQPMRPVAPGHAAACVFAA